MEPLEFGTTIRRRLKKKKECSHYLLNLKKNKFPLGENSSSPSSTTESLETKLPTVKLDKLANCRIGVIAQYHFTLYVTEQGSQ